jgi:hypothetical protein
MFQECKTGDSNLKSTHAYSQRLMVLILLIEVVTFAQCSLVVIFNKWTFTNICLDFMSIAPSA